MAIDDMKDFNGKPYSGMTVGGKHLWDYQNAVWEETKVTPDQWAIKFTALKHRHNTAPVGSGVPLGTEYHWFILADQVVKKTTCDDYTTELTGTKFKLGHKRAYWKGFSYTYSGQQSYKEKLLQVLKDTVKQLEKDGQP